MTTTTWTLFVVLGTALAGCAVEENYDPAGYYTLRLERPRVLHDDYPNGGSRAYETIEFVLDDLQTTASTSGHSPGRGTHAPSTCDGPCPRLSATVAHPVCVPPELGSEDPPRCGGGGAELALWEETGCVLVLALQQVEAENDDLWEQFAGELVVRDGKVYGSLRHLATRSDYVGNVEYLYEEVTGTHEPDRFDEPGEPR